MSFALDCVVIDLDQSCTYMAIDYSIVYYK